MSWLDTLDTPGDHALMIEGSDVQLESVLSVPDTLQYPDLMLIGHPNSIQGGTMNNKVVTTLARLAKHLGLISLRFNFRGVGQSGGQYDNGFSESEDMLKIAQTWQQHAPDKPIIFAGFSFGSFVSYRAAAQHPHRLLLSIAPAIDRHDYNSFQPAPSPWEIIMGEEDEVVPFDQVADFAKSHHIPLLPFPETGHFFHGRLIELRTQVTALLQRHLP